MLSGNEHPGARAIQALQDAIRGFYRKEQRDLPWRKRKDAYAIWVSEVMLQQTQVDTVKKRYAAFLARFATLQDLAAASTEEVCEAWAGLGYYRRARLMHKAAQCIVAQGGVFPQTTAELLALPGVGRYTAGAVASIAFGVPAPILDGNVRRVLSRLLGEAGAADDRDVLKRLWLWAEWLAKADDPGTINQGLMELGATVCLPMPKQPECNRCPWQAWCTVAKTQAYADIPRAAKKVEVKPLVVGFLYTKRSDGAVHLVRRPLTGLWGGMWEMPSVQLPPQDSKLGKDQSDDTTQESVLRELLSQAWEASTGVLLGKVRHRLTHREVVAWVFAASDLAVNNEVAKNEAKSGQAFFDDPMQAPLSTLAKKALKLSLKAR